MMRPTILAPIRMCDVATSSVPPANKNTSKNSYMPPSKRTTKPDEPLITSLDFSSSLFPSIGSATVKPVMMGGFKQKILDLLAKEELDEIERNRLVEVDHRKMNHTELINAGWAILPLTGNIKNAGQRLNATLESGSKNTTVQDSW
jgi:hypothetical protein